MLISWYVQVDQTNKLLHNLNELDNTLNVYLINSLRSTALKNKSPNRQISGLLLTAISCILSCLQFVDHCWIGPPCLNFIKMQR